MLEVSREIVAKPPRTSPHGTNLPWDSPSILQRSSRLVGDYAHEPVCEKGVAAFSNRLVGINVIARMGNACVRCVAGKLPNGNVFIGRLPATENDTLKQKTAAVRRGPRRPAAKAASGNPTTTTTAARGHAAGKFPRISVTVLGAMNRSQHARGRPRVIALMIVARRCAESPIANVSGCCVIVTASNSRSAGILSR